MEKSNNNIYLDDENQKEHEDFLKEQKIIEMTEKIKEFIIKYINERSKVEFGESLFIFKDFFGGSENQYLGTTISLRKKFGDSTNIKGWIKFFMIYNKDIGKFYEINPESIYENLTTKIRQSQKNKGYGMKFR